MSAEYKMEHNPRLKGNDKEQALHPRLVSSGTVGTNHIAQFSQETSSISGPDMKGALAVLARYVELRLQEGYTVHIEGIGYLTPTLQSRPVMDAKELRSESVHFKNVTFRCDKKLKNAMRVMKAYKAPTPKVKQYDLEERRARLIWYLDRYDHITSTNYRALNNCSKYSAQNDLKYFTDEGLLVQTGYRSSTSYRKNENGVLVTERFIPKE